MVVGIIAILIAIMLPTLSNVREQAKTIQCMSQLRQIGFAIQQYTINNGGYTPVWSVTHHWPDDPWPPDPGPGWPVLIERYLGQNPGGAIWNCPSWPDAERRVNYFLGACWMRNQVPIVRSMQISKIRNSTTYIFAGECSAQEYYPPPFGTNLAYDRDDIDKDDGAIKCLRFFGEAGGRNLHRQGNNVLFADNHVATFRKWEPSQLTYSPLSMQTWEDAGPEE